MSGRLEHMYEDMDVYRKSLHDVDDRGLVELIQAQAAERAASHARTAVAIAQLRKRPSMRAQEGHGDFDTLTPDDLTAAEIAAALAFTSFRAGEEVSHAVALEELMPRTMAELSTGVIDYERAQVIARQAVSLAKHERQQAAREGASPREAEERARAAVARLEETVLPKAPKQTRGSLYDRVLTAVARIAPDLAEERRRRAARCRAVSVARSSHRDPDGKDMSDVIARLPSPEAQAVWNVLDAYARRLRDCGDERNLDELRADLFTHLILRGHPPTQARGAGSAFGPVDWSQGAAFDAFGLRANVEVTVSLETLLGLSDEPGQLAGHGTITAQVARDLAFKAGSTWQRLVTDHRGHLVDYGTTRYLPPEPLKQFVRGRDRTCRTPWCDRPSGTCDTDHVRRYPDGPTNAHNLQCKCRRCHRLKHEGRWQHEVLEDGMIRLVSPTGMEYLSEPEDLRPFETRAPRPEPVPEPVPVPVPEYQEPPF